jgi:hypothetical protein
MKTRSSTRQGQSSDELALKLDGMVVGHFVALSESGSPLVDFEGNASGEPVPARTVSDLGAADLGCPVALMFEAGDPERPIALGVIRSGKATGTARGNERVAGLPLEIQVDGERVEISARREISIRTGHASITLTADGKVTIRGKDLLSRSSGANRIRGGSVQLN